MNHVAVILAAGGSHRLGRPKQLLTRDGETLVHRATRLALDTAPARTIVVTGAHDAEVAAAVGDLHCRVAFNPDWESGLAGSVACAARQLPDAAAWVLVLGCDQVRLQAGHLRELLLALPDLRQARDAGTATPLAAACAYRGIVGIPAVVPAAWLHGIDAGAGDRGFGSRLRGLAATQCVIVDDDTLADDIDTPEQLATAIAAGWIDPD